MGTPFRDEREGAIRDNARLVAANQRLQAEIAALREFYSPAARRRRRIGMVCGAMLVVLGVPFVVWAANSLGEWLEQRRWSHANERVALDWSTETAAWGDAKTTLRGVGGDVHGVYVVGDSGTILAHRL